MIVAEQSRVCAAMAICGLALGSAYDALGLLRRGRMVWVIDLLFGPVCAAVMICAGLALRADVCRIYAVLSCALGMAVYMLTIGTIVRKVTDGVRRIAEKREKLDRNLPNDAGNEGKRANCI